MVNEVKSKSTGKILFLMALGYAVESDFKS